MLYNLFCHYPILKAAKIFNSKILLPGALSVTLLRGVILAAFFPNAGYSPFK